MRLLLQWRRVVDLLFDRQVGSLRNRLRIRFTMRSSACDHSSGLCPRHRPRASEARHGPTAGACCMLGVDIARAAQAMGTDARSRGLPTPTR